MIPPTPENVSTSLLSTLRTKVKVVRSTREPPPLPVKTSHPKTIKVNLTDRTVRAVKCPARRSERVVYDTKVPGLCFRVRASGATGFYLIRRVGLKVTRLKLCGPDKPIKHARKLAKKYNAKADEGVNPADQRRQERAAGVTLGDLLTAFIEKHSKPHKKSWADDEAMVERYLNGWKSRKLADLTSDDVRALHAKVGKDHGEFAANRLLALMSAAFRKAKKIGVTWTGGNPCEGVTRFRENSRERFLSADELTRLFAELDAEPNDTIADFIRVSLLTGARRSNVSSMRWEQLDLDGATWRIPETKNGSPLHVPLVPDAVRILKDRLDSRRGECAWVFPARHGNSGHLTDPKTTWKAILARAKITDVRLHDLRRTLGSWMAASGASLPMIGKMLGHKSPATTAIYARLHLDPLRGPAAAATTAMMTPKTPTPEKVTQ